MRGFIYMVITQIVFIILLVLINNEHNECKATVMIKYFRNSIPYKSNYKIRQFNVGHIGVIDFDSDAFEIVDYLSNAEKEILMVFPRYLKKISKDHIFIDVGSNYGLYSYISQMYHVRTLSVDIQLGCLSSVAKWSHGLLLWAAVGSDMLLSSDELLGCDGRFHGSVNGSGVYVPKIKLIDLPKELDHSSIIWKIDVEQSETLIYDEIIDVLWNTKTSLMFLEYTPKWWINPNNFIEFIENIPSKYIIIDIRSQLNIRGMSYEDLILMTPIQSDLMIYDNKVHDLLF
jgi:hypothetical protein